MQVGEIVRGEAGGMMGGEINIGVGEVVGNGGSGSMESDRRGNLYLGGRGREVLDGEVKRGGSS